jgi:tRNA-dihydrouridine synthase 2
VCSILVKQHFSIHSGMGATLLKNPGKLVDILTALVNDVGKPNFVPISVKIRILEDRQETINLVEMLCATGIARVTVHCRTTPMRSREPVIRDQLADIVQICHNSDVQCYANGDVESREHALMLIEEYGIDGCMIARAAETNPSCFREEGLLPWHEVAEEYLRTAVDLGHYFSNTKFCLSHLVPGKSELYSQITKAKTLEALCDSLRISYHPPVGILYEITSARSVSKAVNIAQKSSMTVRAAGGKGLQKYRDARKLGERGASGSATMHPISLQSCEM